MNLPKEGKFRKDIPYLLLILLSVIILYQSLILYPNKQLYPAWDWTSQGKFWKDFTQRSLKEDGQLPLWNPYIFSGLPFFSHPVAATYYYPLNVLFTTFNSNAVFKFYLFFHALMAGVGLFYLVRYLRMERKTALFAAIIFIYGAAFISRVNYGQITNVIAISYVPLLFLFLKRILDRTNWHDSVFLGLILGIQFTSGNVHFFFVSALFLTFYTVMILIQSILEREKLKSILKKLSLLFLALVICLGISSGQILSSIEIASWSARTEADYNYATSLSLPVWHLSSFIFPNIFGSITDGSYIGAENYTELYGYFGIIPLILAAISLGPKKRKDILPWFILGILALLLSFGKYTPLYFIAYKIIPGLSLFRIPSTFLFIYIFSFILLACFGLEKIAEFHQGTKQYVRVRCFLIIVGLLLIFLILLNPIQVIIQNVKPGLEASAINKLVSSSIIHTALIFTLFMLIFLLQVPAKSFAYTLILIAALDLLLIAYPLLKTVDVDEVSYENECIKYIEKDEGYFRLFDMRGISQHVTFQYDIEKITGSDPIILKHYLKFTNVLIGLDYIKTAEHLPIMDSDPDDIKNPVILDLLNVKYIISNKPFSTGERYSLLLNTMDDQKIPLFLYRNNYYLPRAWLVSSVSVLDNQEMVLQNISSLDPLSRIIVDEKSGIKEYSKPPVVGSVQIKKYKPNKIQIEAESSESCYLVLSEVWMPGWHVKVNGNDKNMIRADYLLRAAGLEKGKNEVEVYYIPTTFQSGMILTFTTLVICLIFSVLFVSRGITRRLKPVARSAVFSKLKK